MAITQDVIVINEGFQERRRTTSAGTKSRYTVTVDAKPILHDFADENLGGGPAEAIRAAIVAQIKGITEVAKPSTLLRRQAATRALHGGRAEEYKELAKTKFAKSLAAAGKTHLLGSSGASTVNRYSGGRMGMMTPTGSVRLFNDSGRLAAGIFVRQNPQEKNWTINVPANRLDPSTFANFADFLAMVERLRSFVPVLANPLGDPTVTKAILVGVNGALIRILDRGDQLRAQRGQAIQNIIRQQLG